MNRGGLGMNRGGGRGSFPGLGRGGGRGMMFSNSAPDDLYSNSAPDEDKSNGSQTSTKDLKKDHDLTDFSPMQEAFENDKFNSYTGHVPGASLGKSLHVDSRRGKETIKLHVSNISSRLTKQSLTNIFNHYGNTTDVYIANPQGATTWGFVEYAKLHEAQNAISNLDRAVPHNLNVKFAKEKEPKQIDPGDINTPHFSYKVSPGQRGGRHATKVYGIDPKKLNKTKDDDQNALESNNYHSGQFSHYNPPIQVEANNQMMQKTLMMQSAGNGTEVRGGRAYVPSRPVPEPNEENSSIFQSVEKFEKPTYSEEVKIKIKDFIAKQVLYPAKEEIPQVKYPFKQGNCLNCGDISATVCNVCKAWFCSYKCMESSWGEHKLVCRPRSVSFQSDGTVQYHDSKDLEDNRGRPTFQKIRKPHGYSDMAANNQPLKSALKNTEELPKANGTDETPEDESPNSSQPSKSSGKISQIAIDFLKHPPEPRDEGYVQTPQGLVTDRNVKFETGIKKRDLPTGRNIPTKPAIPESTTKAISEPEPPIPRGEFTTCFILYINSEGRYFVTPSFLMEAEHKMMADLAEYFSQSRRSIADVSPGVICGAFFDDGLWYRVQVTAYNEKSGVAQYSFIDFGNTGEGTAPSLKVLPDWLLKPPPMAFGIVFVGEPKSYQINDSVDISPIKLSPCGSWLVRTREDPEPEEEVEEKVTEEAAPTSYPLANDRFQEVTILHVEKPGMYWIVTLDGMAKLIKLNEDLKESARNRVKITPELNKIYNYEFSGVWCRALLTKLDPLTVFFIDYGNDLKVEAKDLLPVPVTLAAIPPLAIRIKLAEGTSSKYFELEELQMITIRAFGKVSSYVLALVEGERYVQSVLDHELSKVEAPPKKDPVHVVSLLTPQSDAYVVVKKTVGEDFFCGSLHIANGPPPFLSVNDISKALKSKKANPGYKPSVNDDVIAKINEDSRLYRGYIMCVEENNPKVALIDIGCVETPRKLAELPPEFKKYLPCGVRISLHRPITSSMAALLGSELTLANIEITGDEVTADVGCHGRATIEPWVPMLEEALIPAFKLEDKCLTVITAFHSPQAVYVRPLTEECVEAFKCVLQDVCAFSMTSETLEKPPRLGELVCARWSVDNNFYRALVSKKVKERFTVIFLDFGNIETVGLDDMRPLPDNFKKIPATVVKIGLKDVPGPVFNNVATQLITDFVAKEITVIVSYKEDLRYAVLTAESSGEIVNDILIEAMEPSWTRKTSSDIIAMPPYMSENINYENWKEGAKLTGAIVSAPSYNEIFFVNSSHVFEYVHTVMAPQMTKYCEETDQIAYNPRPREFVLAKYEGAWYRAVCSSEPRMCHTPTAQVMFIDYGNVGEISTEDLRKMVPDFAHFPAAVKQCNIYGYPRPESIPQELQEKIVQTLVSSETVELVVVKEFENGNCVVWIPSLENTLADFGITFTRPVGFS